MSELGELLKNTRLDKKKTLSAVSADTKIRESFLAAIEEGDYKALPSYLHAYGFVKKYAEYLGFSYEDIKGLFNAEYPKPGMEEEIKEEGETGAGERVPKKSSGKMWWVVIVVAIAVFVIYLAYGYFAAEKDAPPPSIAEVPVIDNDGYNSLLDSLSADNLTSANMSENETGYVPAPLEDNVSLYEGMGEEVPEAAHQNVTDPITVYPRQAETPIIRYVTLSFTEDCWVYYMPDNGSPEEFTAIAGTVKRLSFKNGFTLDIGNAAAISIKYGNENFTDFGRRGAVIKNLRYEVTDGVLQRVYNR